MTPIDKGIEVMNKALRELYAIQGLSIKEIIQLLREFEYNETEQLEQDEEVEA